MKIITFSILSFFFLFGISFAHAQYTDVINSNRPGVSQTAYSVGKRVIQLEVGPYYVKEEHKPLNNEVSGFGVDFAAHYGLFFENLELNLQGIYQNDTFTDNRSVIVDERDRSNFKTFSIGAKYLVFDPHKNAEEEKPNLYSWKANKKFKWKDLIPAVAVSAGVHIDGKDNPFLASGVNGISPRVMVGTQNNFSGGWVFVTNFLMNRIGTDQDDFQYILTLTHSFNPKWVVFAETQGIDGDFYSDNLFRAGGAYLFSKDFQLDTAVTINTKDTPTVLNINFGMSYRFDFHEDEITVEDNLSKEDKKASRKAKKKSKKRAKKSKRKGEDFDDGNEDDGLN